jgi:hypothetical protein
MVGRTLLAILGGREPSQRLQVSLSQADDGRLLIDLREQHHADGIGWFDQRRLELDPRQFQQLQAVLALKSASIELTNVEAPATVPFPGPPPTRTERPAAGGNRG